MTKYQQDKNMLTLDMISEIERLIAERQFNSIANMLLADRYSRYTLYVTEGSASPDYVSSLQLDHNREKFMEQLLNILNVFNRSVYSIKITIERDNTNSHLWHKVWTIDID